MCGTPPHFPLPAETLTDAEALLKTHYTHADGGAVRIEDRVWIIYLKNYFFPSSFFQLAWPASLRGNLSLSSKQENEASSCFLPRLGCGASSSLPLLSPKPPLTDCPCPGFPVTVSVLGQSIHCSCRWTPFLGRSTRPCQLKPIPGQGQKAGGWSFSEWSFLASTTLQQVQA